MSRGSGVHTAKIRIIGDDPPSRDGFPAERTFRPRTRRMPRSVRRFPGRISGRNVRRGRFREQTRAAAAAKGAAGRKNAAACSRSALFFVILENFRLCLIQRTLEELPDFEVMTWQLCRMLRSALNCFQVTRFCVQK